MLESWNLKLRRWNILASAVLKDIIGTTLQIWRAFEYVGLNQFCIADTGLALEPIAGDFSVFPTFSARLTTRDPILKV